MPTSPSHILLDLLPGMAYRCLNDNDWTMLEVSAGAKQLTGFQTSDFINNRRCAYADLIHPDDQAVVWQEVQHQLAKQECFDLEYRIIHKDGSIRHVWEHGEGIFEHGKLIELVGFISNQTPNAHIQHAIRRGQAAIVELSKSQHLSQGNVTSFAEQLCVKATQVLDVERASIWQLDKKHSKLELLCLFDTQQQTFTHGTVLHAEQFPDYFAALEQGRIIDACYASSDTRTHEFAQEYLPATNVQSMLDACIRVSGDIVGVVCCEKVGQTKRWAMEDISFAGELADQMALAINNRRWLDETALLREAQASNHTKSHLLASISHEIRTPMNGVLGMVELLQATPLNEQQQQLLQVISDSGELLLNIINDVLDYGKADAGKLQLKETDTHIEKAIEHSILLLKKQVKDGVTVQSQRQPGLPEFLRVDAYRLRQVLLNLLGNAIKFTEQGSINIYYGPAGHDYWQMTLQDTGSGIAAEQLPNLFTPFSQFHDEDHLLPQRGTGLGLSICKQIVDAMDGNIEVQSELGKGTTITVTLPMRGASEQINTTHHEPQPHQYPDMRVLVAEDNPVNQHVIAGLLKSHGIAAELCNNGQEAVARVLAANTHYDLILMDGQMPVLNGFEASLQIRANPMVKQPVIAALTAHALDEFRQRAKASGMDFYLTKPLRRQDISDLLEDVRQQRHSG